jgi:8-oxo-dGTP pyrophosphatase MutT (NUDIX family)
MTQKTIVIACATVIEEMLPLMPEGMEQRTLEFGLHIYPDRLRTTLKATVDELVAAHPGEELTLLLGYGLCSQALVGVEARGCTLILPRVDDCIAIFLGSRSAYKEQAGKEPGTYYLTKGWVEVGETPFTEYEYTVARYGQARAERLFKIMMANYKRLALINTGQYEIEKYRAYARETAERFGLRFEEIPGATSLVEKLLFGPWDEEFVVLQPGETFRLDHFYHS